MSDGVRFEPNLTGREVCCSRRPDLDRVHPGVLGGGGEKRHVKPELSDGRSWFRNDNAVCGDRYLLAVFGRKLGVEVELDTAVGTHVEVVHALDRALELPLSGSTLDVGVEARSLRGVGAAPDSSVFNTTPYSVSCVICAAFS